jgi:Domain of unknown function (DUF397)
MGEQVRLPDILSIQALVNGPSYSLNSPIRDVSSISWRKSSLSTYNGNCVEIGRLGDNTIGVRDTKDKGRGSVLAFTQDEWSAFLGGAKAGEFDSI